MTQKKKLGNSMINTCKNDTRQHYIPVEKLTYATRLKQMLREELGFQGKPKVLDLLVSEIEAITNECYVNEQQVGLGQIRVMVPSIEDRPGWGQTIEETKLVTVTLTLFSSEDTEGYKINEKSALILQRRLARMAREAVRQNGVLSHATAACLLGIKQSTVSKYAAAYYQRERKIIPLRGYVHDIGRTTTHKRWIIEMYLKGYTEREIQQRTDHKIQSIERYLRRYRSVEQAIEELHTLDAHKISRLLGISVNAAKEYAAIYAEYMSTSKIRRLDYYADINNQTKERIDADGKINIDSKE
jgi:predicted XRE-type DNA-binding protein